MGTLIDTSDNDSPNKQSIRIAMLHLDPRYDNVSYNVALLEKLFLMAVRLQPDIIVTPELAVSGYGFYKILGKEWMKSYGYKIIEKFSKLAQENNVALILGSPVYTEKSNKYYNAALFIDEQGQVIGEHHKINVLPGSEDWSSPGSEIKPVEWRGYKIGLLICSDAYTENIAGELAKQGANVLFSPAAWGPGLHEPDGEWEQRSKETRLCLYVCNRTGNEDVLNFEGSSSAVVVDGYRRVEYAMKQTAILTIDVEAGSWLPRSDKFTIRMMK
jgi:predicted amidohydrolase